VIPTTLLLLSPRIAAHAHITAAGSPRQKCVRRPPNALMRLRHRPRRIRLARRPCGRDSHSRSDERASSLWAKATL
jgi:hypothetical protein